VLAVNSKLNFVLWEYIKHGNYGNTLSFERFVEGMNAGGIVLKRVTSVPNSRFVAGPAVNPLTPNGRYNGRTAPLTSKSCILYIYSTNIGTEYFKHSIYSPFSFSLKCSLFHNSNLFGSCNIDI